MTLKERNETMSSIPVRAITVHIGDPHPLSNTAIMRAKKFLTTAAKLFLEAEIEIQMLGVATRPLFLDLGHTRASEITEYAHTLQMRCEDLGIHHLSIGPLLADNPKMPVERVNVLPEILASNSALYATVQIASNTYGIRIEAAQSAARIIRELSTIASTANVRFAVVANCPHRSPFIHATYQSDGEWGFSIGLQSASLVKDTLGKVAFISRSGSDLMEIASEYLITALKREGRRISNLALQLAREQNMPFDGLDLSPMPNGADSIAKAVEAVGMAFFAEPLTVTILSTITSALTKTGLKTCGFNSIFLPVHEDELIASRVASGQMDVSHFMLYASVCDGALDGIPIAIDTPDTRIEAMILDCATIATAFSKPIIVRLLPISDQGVREVATFDLVRFATVPLLRI